MDIIKKLQTIFKEKFNIELREECFSQNIYLGSTGIGLNAIELFYLINFIESEFHIQFTREHIVSGVIRTLPGLCQSIHELCKETVTELAVNS